MTEREDAAEARIDLAKALLRFEAMPRREADLFALREELKAERQERTAATQQAAVLEAKLDAARERAAQAEEIAAEARSAVTARDASRCDTGRVNGVERRSQLGKNI
jgi:hypothetical protein